MCNNASSEEPFRDYAERNRKLAAQAEEIPLRVRINKAIEPSTTKRRKLEKPSRHWINSDLSNDRGPIFYVIKRAL